jgi:uncharacterized protein (TIGR02270 family)
MMLSALKREFTLALCEEHLDEAAFLYAQRQRILSGEAAAPWPDAKAFEERLEAHLDALSIEGELAIEACKARAASTDPGDLYAVVRVACQNHHGDLIDLVFEKLPTDNERKIIAVSRALTDEAPDDLERICEILKAHPEHPEVWAGVGADCRLKDAWPPPQSAEPSALAPRLRFAGRIYQRDAASELSQALSHEDADVRSEAALALLRLERGHRVMQHCRSENFAMIDLGLGGGPSEVCFLLQLATKGPVTDALLISLGLLGDISAFPLLIKSLGDASLSKQAAEALELITGAHLKETLFVPDPIDKNELFKEELEKYQRGESPYPEGKEPGVTVDRICRNPDEWKIWIEGEKAHFSPGIRYRNGAPLTPSCLIDNMKSESLPTYLRQLAYEELPIRYRVDFPFDTDRPTGFQEKAINAYEAWAKSPGNAFRSGGWYIAARLLS